MARKYNTPVEPECCEKCGKTIPPRYPPVEYDEYWCKGHSQPKRKRGRPRKHFPFNPRLGEKVYAN